MTKVIYNHRFPAIDRDEFLTPFDRMFDQIINTQFPEIEKQVGVISKSKCIRVRYQSRYHS